MGCNFSQTILMNYCATADYWNVHYGTLTLFLIHHYTVAQVVHVKMSWTLLFIVGVEFLTLLRATRIWQDLQRRKSFIWGFSPLLVYPSAMNMIWKILLKRCNNSDNVQVCLQKLGNVHTFCSFHIYYFNCKEGNSLVPQNWFFSYLSDSYNWQ